MQGMEINNSNPLAYNTKNRNSARQKHGFLYEEKVISEHNLIACQNSTAKWDAFTNQNVPVSIKTHRNNCIELGSWLRQSQIDTDFYLMIGFWDDPISKTVTEEYKLLIPCSFWKQQFPLVYRQHIMSLFANVSHEREWDTVWKNRLDRFLDNYKSFASRNGIFVKMNAKRDHKTQLRMQCSILYSDIINMATMYGVSKIE